MANIIGGGSKDTVFDNGTLRILGNLFNTENAFIQIANISQVRVGRLPQRSYMSAVVITALAILCFILRSSVLGFLFLVVAFITGAYIYNKNNDNKYGLFLDMNSGSSAIYASSDMTFLREVANVLGKVIAGLYKEDIVVNFTDNSIRDVHGAVVTGGQVGNITTMGA